VVEAAVCVLDGELCVLDPELKSAPVLQPAVASARTASAKSEARAKVGIERRRAAPRRSDGVVPGRNPCRLRERAGVLDARPGPVRGLLAERGLQRPDELR
jgi:hypothetical protein